MIYRVGRNSRFLNLDFGLLSALFGMGVGTGKMNKSVYFHQKRRLVRCVMALYEIGNLRENWCKYVSRRASNLATASRTSLRQLSKCSESPRYVKQKRR